MQQVQMVSRKVYVQKHSAKVAVMVHGDGDGEGEDGDGDGDGIRDRNGNDGASLRLGPGQELHLLVLGPLPVEVAADIVEGVGPVLDQEGYSKAGTATAVVDT